MIQILARYPRPPRHGPGKRHLEQARIGRVHLFQHLQKHFLCIRASDLQSNRFRLFGRKIGLLKRKQPNVQCPLHIPTLHGYWPLLRLLLCRGHHPLTEYLPSKIAFDAPSVLSVLSVLSTISLPLASSAPFCITYTI